MVFVPGGDFCLEHILVEVAAAVRGLVFVAVLFDKGQETTWVKEGTEPVGGHLLFTLDEDNRNRLL